MIIPPCLVLFASSSTRAMEELAAHPYGAVLTPVHIVVSARGSQTEVHLLRAVPLLDGPWERPALTTLTAIHHVVETIGMRSLDA
jgi:hypothetical protein